MLLRRALAIACTSFVVAVAAGVLVAPAASAAAPNSMASMGDSITRAFTACGWYTGRPGRAGVSGGVSRAPGAPAGASERCRGRARAWKCRPRKTPPPRGPRRGGPRRSVSPIGDQPSMNPIR